MIIDLMIWVVLFVPLISGTVIDSICFGELSLDLPVRYLHIQILENGANATSSKGPIGFKVDAPDCRYSADVADRGDGMYVFRIELHSQCRKFTVKLTLKGHTLCESPIIVQKHGRSLQPDSCNCPIPLEQWLEEAKCSDEPQIESDLSHWDNISFDDVLTKARNSFGRPEHSRTFSVCHYQIIDNQVYRECFGEYSDFKQFLDKALRSVLNKMTVPNTEFIFNLGDYPLSMGKNPLPIVAWCGSTSSFDIVLPTYDLTGIAFSGIREGRQMYPQNLPQWEEKEDRAVFRGRDSNKLRLELASLSNREPSLLDAGITAYFFHKEEEYTPKKASMPLNDFFKYRYVVSIDGTVAAYRMPRLLAGNSLILKADSPYYEHFYSKMQPFKHFIPFNATNMKARLVGVRTKDHTKTILNGRQFWLDHLQPKNIYCYFAKFFQAYTKKLVSPPIVPSSAVEKAPDEDTSECRCHDEARTEL